MTNLGHVNQRPDIGILPISFATAVHELSCFAWDRRIHISEREPPQIAPYAAAVDAEIVIGNQDVGHGRLILLHSPGGDQSWEGDFRCVTFAQAEVTPDMIHDPFLAYVGWSWLTDALETHCARYVCESGTITTTASVPFGTMQEEQKRSQIEIRASWTPLISTSSSLNQHLKPWQDLLCLIAGIPPDDDTIVALPSRIATSK